MSERGIGELGGGRGNLRDGVRGGRGSRGESLRDQELFFYK